MRSARRLGLSFALAVALGACSGAPQEAFDLSPVHPRLARAGNIGLRVRTPQAAPYIDGVDLLVRAPDRSLARLGGAQWAQPLRDLVASRIVQSFQNAGGPQAFSESEASGAPFDLVTDIRTFEFDAAPSEVRVAIHARLVDARNGAVVAARLFEAVEPVASQAPATVAAAFDKALGETLSGLVRFAAARL